MRDRLHVPAHFRTVDEVAAGLAELDAQFRVAHDRRRLFVMAYVAMTQTIAQWIARGIFQDGCSMERYVVAFANEYRRALADSDSGWKGQSAIPEAWRQSFEACTERREIFRCLMLGINAHMKRDLPYAIVAAGVDVNSAVCYNDHILIDDILKINLPVVRRRIACAYGAELPLGQRWLGHFALSGIHREFRDARKSAW